MEYLKGKTILVSGACGSVGGALVKRLLSEASHAPDTVIGIDNNERGLFFLDQRYLADERARFFVCDICDAESLIERMRGIDVVIHTAALKHVVLCERSPIDTNRTNVRGVQNVIETAARAGVQRVIFTSSDKAVNPVNVMGASKQTGEQMITAAAGQSTATVYASIRFGNVAGSSGSVIPIFHRQIAGGGPVTLTDPEMIRFVMGVERAVDLIVESAQAARGGEIFVTKMPVARVADIAAVMIRELAPLYQHRAEDVEIEIIGAKSGEKLHEELMSQEEALRALEMPRYFVILPEDRIGQGSSAYVDAERVGLNKPYVASGQTPLDQDELTAFLRDNGLLDAGVPDPL